MRYPPQFLSIIGMTMALWTLGCSASTRATTAETPKATEKINRAFKLDPKMLDGIKIETLKENAAPSYLMASGKVQFNEDELANIIPPVPGQVQDLKIKVGDHVQKGDVLFFIYSRDVATSLAEHIEAHKDLDLAEKTYARTKDLFEHEAASRTAFDQTESERAKAQSKVNRTEETLRVLGVAENEMHSVASAKIPVRSSLSGTVTERKLTEGQFVQPDVNPLVTIADMSSVWVMADVFERDLRFVSVGNRADVTADAYPDEHFSARVSRINDVVDPNTRAVKVRFLVANPGQRLKPEMFASARIALTEAQRAIFIPPGAVFTDSGRSYAYVVAGDGEFEQRQIEVSQEASERLRVVNGLQAGEKIVIDGVLLIHAEQLKAPE